MLRPEFDELYVEKVLNFIVENVPESFRSSTAQRVNNVFMCIDRLAFDKKDDSAPETINLVLSSLSKQEPLGKEFEKILYDNLWDLYIER